MDEIVDVVDKNDVPTGELKRKLSVHEDGDWHRVAHVWIATPDGKLLCQKRSATKKHFPNLWDVIHGGHVKAGSDYLETAIEELREEINLDVNPQDLIEIGMYKLDNLDGIYRYRDICKAFLLIYRGRISDLKVDNDEVSELKAFEFDDLLELLKDPVRKKIFLPGLLQENYYDTAIRKIRSILKKI